MMETGTFRSIRIRLSEVGLPEGVRLFLQFLDVLCRFPIARQGLYPLSF